MKKSVKSTDPRKKTVMQALKTLTGANKITNVFDLGNSEFSGDCLKGNQSGYEKLGTFTTKIVWKEEE